MSAADDGIVRLWDISQGEKISDLPVHSGKIDAYCMCRMYYILVLDYCRAGETAPNDPNIFCSGGYDNMVNVLDLRSQEITMSFNHGAPVESICLFPSMSLIVSSGKIHQILVATF